ncbi:hypothetical protein GCM10023238_03140 [Streptomyces heliomycini]
MAVWDRRPTARAHGAATGRPARRQWSESDDSGSSPSTIERNKILSVVPGIRARHHADGIAVEIGQDEFSAAIQDLINRALDPVEECHRPGPYRPERSSRPY